MIVVTKVEFYELWRYRFIVIIVNILIAEMSVVIDKVRRHLMGRTTANYRTIFISCHMHVIRLLFEVFFIIIISIW
jgi:hypothetical protein